MKLKWRQGDNDSSRIGSVYEEISMKFIPLYNKHVQMAICCYFLESQSIFE